MNLPFAMGMCNPAKGRAGHSKVTVTWRHKWLCGDATDDSGLPMQVCALRLGRSPRVLLRMHLEGQ